MLYFVISQSLDFDIFITIELFIYIKEQGKYKPLLNTFCGGTPYKLELISMKLVERVHKYSQFFANF